MDFFGKGFLWGRPEWRIYRGHKRDRKYAYYCVGKVNVLNFFKYNKGKVECWHSEQDYRMYKNYLSGKDVNQHARKPPVFRMIQKVNEGFHVKALVAMIPCGNLFWSLAAKVAVMDAYDIWIAPGEDTALLQAFSVVWGWSIGDSV